MVQCDYKLMIAKLQYLGMTKGGISALLATFFLCACSDGVKVPENKLTAMQMKPSSEKRDSVDEAFTAALSPLEDLGVRKRKIPDQLKALTDNPYVHPDAKVECDVIRTEYAALDGILGPEMGKPKAALSATEQYMNTGTDMVQDAVIGAIKSQVSIIPMRSVVRRLTGANSHDKQVAKATEAGKLRRAYLRGYAEAKFGKACSFGPVEVTGDDLPTAPPPPDTSKTQGI